MTWKIVVFCIFGGLFISLSALHAGHFGWWLLDGIVVSACLVPVVRFGPRSVFALWATIAPVMVVVGIWCTLSEGVLFYPEFKAKLMQSLVGGTVMYLLAAALLAIVARVLSLREDSAAKVETRPLAATIPLVLLAGLSYVAYYYIFGAIAFNLYTKQFFPHAAEQVAALGTWFPIYQWGRGLAMTLAVLPMIYTLRMKRWQAALAVGIAVWIVGGGGPLLVPNGLMIPAQRFAHILEIMTQNVPLGVTAVWLLRRRSAAANVSAGAAVHA